MSNVHDYSRIVGRGGGENQFHLAFFGVDNTYRVYAVDDSGNDYNVASQSISTEEWRYVTGVYDGSELMLYINGVRVASSTLNINLSSSTNDFLIGAGEPNLQHYAGRLSDVRIYDRALSQSEVKALYLGFGPQPTGHLALK